MYNSRIPTDSSIIDSVALQDDGKAEIYDDTDAAMDLSGNPVPASTGNKGSHTIEFYALGRSSPTTSMALWISGKCHPRSEV